MKATRPISGSRYRLPFQTDRSCRTKDARLQGGQGQHSPPDTTNGWNTV
jgi:hypothetical protein